MVNEMLKLTLDDLNLIADSLDTTIKATQDAADMFDGTPLGAKFKADLVRLNALLAKIKTSNLA